MFMLCVYVISWNRVFIHLKDIGGLAHSSYSGGLSLAKPSFSPELFSNIFLMAVSSYLQHM
jgi:hypothetical protein